MQNHPVSEPTPSPADQSYLPSEMAVQSSSHHRPLQLESEQMKSLALKYETLEMGLGEVRSLIRMLKATCGALEMRTESLTIGISEMKQVLSLGNQPLEIQHGNNGPPPIVPLVMSSSDGPASTGVPDVVSQRFQPSSSTHSDAISTTPLQVETSSDIKADDHDPVLPPLSPPTTPPRSILGKRRKDDSDEDTINDADSSRPSSPFTPQDSSTPARRSHKRVRFADLGDLSVDSSVDETPPPLPEASNGELKPCNSDFVLSREQVFAEITGTHSSTSNIPSRTTQHHNGTPGGMPLENQNVDSQGRPRKKTKWDPATGKRIPVPIHSGKPPTKVEDMEISEHADYERHLIAEFTNASL